MKYLFFILLVSSSPLLAQDFNDDLDYAQVLSAELIQRGDSWTVSVTVRHNDQGWDHYADLWEVVNPENGKILGSRVLAHPHDTEQPFTRSLSGVQIPGGVTKILIRSRCNLHGFEGRQILVDLTQPIADDYRIR